MDCARRHHAAPMGLKTVLFGLVYYKHVAPMELAVAAQRQGERWLALQQLTNLQAHAGPAIRSAAKLGLLRTLILHLLRVKCKPLCR
jgi:hypothetical protein